MSGTDDKLTQPERVRDIYGERLPELEPTEFHEGFTARTVVGALFVAFVMMPGVIYMTLMVGTQLGDVAAWTTIILFAEIARRSFTPMRRQELYILFYLTTALSAAGLFGFGWLIWAQYLRGSPAAVGFGLVNEIPNWFAPRPDSPAVLHHTFLHRAWAVPILLLVINQVIGRMQWLGLGYLLFRATSDIERLPFPMAPVAAQGATALAEVTRDEESWRWPVFSVGAMVGLCYGAIYVLVPVVTGALFTTPFQIIRIPFIDLTPNTENIFPAGQIALGTDLGAVFQGFVLPLPIVVGQFIASISANFLLAPTLYHVNPQIFPDWRLGMNVIQTGIATSLNFWMSIAIGIAVSIFVIGSGQVFMTWRRSRSRAAGSARGIAAPPPGRGDFPVPLAVAAWLIAAVAQIVVIHRLVPEFPLWILITFGLVWSPINSYISARLIGLTSRGVGIPYLDKATFILSGYKHADIWFAGAPLYDQGWAAQRFREIELTGTKFTSVVKAEAFLLVVMLGCSFLFWQFFWKLGPIPSASYPFVQTFWPQDATFTLLWATATREGGQQQNWLIHALKPHLMGIGFGGAVGLYTILALAKAPMMWFYGLAGGIVAGGIDSSTARVIPMFAGAMLGRYYFRRRFGLHRWRLYAPVLMAGYACGQGLMGMTGIAIAIILKSVRVLPY